VELPVFIDRLINSIDRIIDSIARVFIFSNYICRLLFYFPSPAFLFFSKLHRPTFYFFQINRPTFFLTQSLEIKPEVNWKCDVLDQPPLNKWHIKNLTVSEDFTPRIITMPWRQKFLSRRRRNFGCHADAGSPIVWNPVEASTRTF
jgi:hypothetical protein